MAPYDDWAHIDYEEEELEDQSLQSTRDIILESASTPPPPSLRPLMTFETNG